MKITIDDFKQQVMADYKIVVKSSHVAKSMSHQQQDDIMPCCDLAQIVLSKFVTDTDIFMASRQNIAFNLSQGLPSNETITDNATTILKAGELAAPRVMVYAAGRLSFDLIYSAIVHRLPIAFVWYNVEEPENGIKTSNSDILKLLSGFTSLHKDRISASSVRGGDYVALYSSLGKQLDYSRRFRCPSVTIIEKCDDSIKEFAKWITDKELFDQDTLDRITV